MTMEIADGKTILLAGIRELSRGNEREALEAFARALEGTEDVTAALCAARRLILERAFGEAAVLLQELVRREPDLAEAHYLLGRAHQRMFQNPEAIRSFRQALALDPGDPRADASLRLLLDVQEP